MTNLKINSFLSFTLILVFSLFFLQCKKDDNSSTNGQVNFEVTDAPIDNAEVQGAFVTISAITVDGKNIELENKQTINLLSYQDGNTKSLRTAELEAGAYSKISLVLDLEKDANGNVPGCYVLTTDNKKHNLDINGNTTNAINLTNSTLNVEGNSQTDFVMDFDLRKSIKNNQNNAESSYSFVTNNEMKAAVRAVLKSETGMFDGNCANAGSYSERTIVYAYKKGTYTKAVEMEGQGESNIEFSNAVTSAVVAPNGDFSLHFLEAGQYEIHFAAYEDSNSDGKYELKGMLETSVVGSLDLLSLTVEAKAAVSLNITAIGLIL